MNASSGFAACNKEALGQGLIIVCWPSSWTHRSLMLMALKVNPALGSAGIGSD